MNIYQEINAKFPPASQNNARAIVRGIVDRANERPSDSRMQEVERDFGFVADHSDRDWGEEPRIINEE